MAPPPKARGSRQAGPAGLHPRNGRCRPARSAWAERFFSTIRAAWADRHHRPHTAETAIIATLALDGTGQVQAATGIGFLDHMLTALGRHALFDLAVEAKGDLHIDFHHTTEDVGIVLGQCLRQALGDKRGIRRYGQALLPMDEALAEAAVDISGRPFLAWSVPFARDKVGEMDTELFEEFFRAFAFNAGITLHVTLKAGSNAHHVAEACFKALARALRMAVETDPRAPEAVPSTKGVLEA